MTTLGYDGAERLTSETFPTTGQPSLGFTYNTDDTLSGFTDGVGATAYTYDPAGRVTKVVYNYAPGGLSAAQELDYTYYPEGLRHTLTWKNGSISVGTWTYSYDGAGRLTGLTNPFSEGMGWAYDGEGKLTQQTNQNGTSVLYGYNNQRGWPVTLTDKLGANTYASYALTYDQGGNTVGNLTGVTEADGSTETYGYDALYRLTSESRTGTNAQSQSYGYDPAGNLTTISGTPIAYDAANKITTYDTHNTNFFSYDKDGNQVGDYLNASSYVWDDRGDLTSRTVAGQVGYAYGYNASGQRVHTVVTYQGTTSANTFYVYDGDKVLGEVSSAGVVTAAYTWGADGLVSERLSTASPAKSLWYQFGPQGETRALTNSAGAVVDSYSYTAYGKSLSASGGDANPFQYGGKYGYYSEYNGAVLCGHRWYDTHDTLRWLSRDPIGYGGGANLYAYCGGDPVNEGDANGLDPNYFKSSFYTDPKHWHGGQPPLPDVPPGFNIDKNIAQADRWGAWGNIFAWKHAVQTGGIWDPKNFNDPLTNMPYKLNPPGKDMDDAGNFNFGATGKSVGLRSCDLYRGAGGAQAKNGPMGWASHPQWGDPPLLSNGYLGSPPYYGDDPAGHHGTNYGIIYYEYWYAPHHGLSPNKW